MCVFQCERDANIRTLGSVMTAHSHADLNPSDQG